MEASVTSGGRVIENPLSGERIVIRTSGTETGGRLLAWDLFLAPLSKRTVRDFAEAMRRGDWRLTHQGIAFDASGALVDGQHRLAAIVEADVPVEITERV
jgi:hypothetical protein